MWNFPSEFKWFGIAFFLTAIIPNSVDASLTLEGKWAAGPCEIVDSDGSYAFFNAGINLIIADISDPASPVVRGEFQFPVSLTGIEVSDRYAFVLLGEYGLRVLDVSDPTSPVEVGGLEATNSATNIVMNGDTAYLIDGGLRILDVSDPASPTQIGFHEAWGTAATISDNLLFLVGGSMGLLVFDVSNPMAPQPMGSFHPDPSIDFEDIVVKGQRAYVCANGNHLFGIDISNPNDPTYFISEYRHIYDWATRLCLVDGNLWVVGRTGLTVFELQDPSIMPFVQEHFEPLREGRAIAANGDLGFVSEYQNGLAVFESTGSGIPVRVGGSDTRGIPKDIATFHAFACLAMGDRGLHIIDVTQPEFIIEVAGLESLRADAVHVSGHYAYVLGGDLSIVDLSDPANPVVMGQIPFPDARYISVHGGFAYMSGGSYPLMIADVSDPANPMEIYSAPLRFKVTHGRVAVADDYTFVPFSPWNWYSGVTITNVSNPGDPTFAGAVKETQVSGITARGDELFLVDVGLRVMNVSNPEFPIDLGTLAIDGCHGDLAVEGKTAYVAAGGIFAIDISDYSMMEVTEHYDTGSGAVAVAAVGEIVLLADTDEGLLVFRDGGTESQEVVVDIKPGDDDNRVNCGNRHGLIPVAILSDNDFDALSIDHTTVRFGPGEAREAHTNRHGPIRHEEDVDRDGDLDLVFHFRLAETGIQCGDTEVTLTGENFDGQAIIGGDMIQTFSNGFMEDSPDREIRITPNPFNPQTTISFYTDEPQQVRLAVYDLRGRRVAELTDQQYQVGEHSVEWRGRDASGRAVPSGEYFFRIEIGSQVEIRKAMLLR